MLCLQIQLFILSLISLSLPFKKPFHEMGKKKNKLTSSVYDCTVEDVEYIYNKLSI